jgi:hypothetical protein
LVEGKKKEEEETDRLLSKEKEKKKKKRKKSKTYICMDVWPPYRICIPLHPEQQLSAWNPMDRQTGKKAQASEISAQQLRLCCRLSTIGIALQMIHNYVHILQMISIYICMHPRPQAR